MYLKKRARGLVPLAEEGWLTKKAQGLLAEEVYEVILKTSWA